MAPCLLGRPRMSVFASIDEKTAIINGLFIFCELKQIQIHFYEIFTHLNTKMQTSVGAEKRWCFVKCAGH